MAKKNIKLIDIFLLMAASVIDLYQEFKDPLNLFSNYYQQLTGSVPPRWKKDNLRALFKYCLKKKYLKKESNFKTGKFVLTKKTIRQLKSKYPFYFYNLKNWDKKIRLVIFDVKEINRNKRNRLRYFLKKLGFVMIQKSLWLCPFDHFHILKKWLKENLIAENIMLLEATEINIKNKNLILDKFYFRAKNK